MDEKKLREFVFNGLLLQDSFDALQKEGISVSASGDFQQVTRVVEADFSPRVWHDATNMASVYQAIFCIENTMRSFIVERMSERHGLDWWEEKVNIKIKKAVKSLRDKEEKNKFFSSRSDSDIGYTMFGNLGQLIIDNWEDFSDIIPSPAWLSSRMADLEMARNIVMHTGVLPQVEIDRISSITRDILRQIG
jgi:hypothetical protein